MSNDPRSFSIQCQCGMTVRVVNGTVQSHGWGKRGVYDKQCENSGKSYGNG